MQLSAALSEYGLVFYCTAKDAERFETKHLSDIQKVKSSIPSPEDVLTRGRVVKNEGIIQKYFISILENTKSNEEPVVLARAARNLDGEISKDIETKMHTDRLRAISKFK